MHSHRLNIQGRKGMIIKNNANKKEFLDEIKEKKLYCYGAGKVFEDFLTLYQYIDIYSVIDRKSDVLKNKFENIKFITLKQFIEECDDKNAVLLITCFDYSEIEEQLQKEKSLNKLSCYVYYIMQEYEDVENQQRDSGKYQMSEFRYQDCMAGQKAPADVKIILSHVGYKIITLNRGTVTRGTIQTDNAWKNIADALEKNAILILQLPLIDNTDGIYKILEIKKKKNIKIIGIVHDVNVVRGNPTEYDYRQYKILKELPDVLIVHNERMMKILRDMGFAFYNMVNLEIFDYLINDYEEAVCDDGIIIAGNLDKQKAGYIYNLHCIEGVTFNLFGANYNEKEKYTNMNYFGAFLPDELIKNLKGKYGLVWDGDSIETCSGGKGEYLRINNPHKLSLYLAVGLPVIIWDEAAEAEFVLRENVGFTIKSLYELSEKMALISDDDYEIMKKNAEVVGARLRNGKYMTNAIKKAEKIIREIGQNENI